MCLLNVMTFFCGTRFILWYNIRLTCLTVSLPSSALFTRSKETCNQNPKRWFRQKSIKEAVSWNLPTFTKRELDIFYVFYFFCFYLWYQAVDQTKTTQGAFQKPKLADQTMAFFREFFLMKNYFLHACYLGFDWFGWIALIKSEFLITTGMAWPVSSDKWKAP